MESRCFEEKNRYPGKILWFTGLSGAGKSTLCYAVAARISKLHLPVEVLDGDILRCGLCADLGFSDRDRGENNRRIAHVAKLLSAGGSMVLVATMAPLEQHRAIIREILPAVLEVFVDAPLETCIARDPKGLYKRAFLGEIQDLSGVSAPFEAPAAPWLTLHTKSQNVESCVYEILDALDNQKNNPDVR